MRVLSLSNNYCNGKDNVPVSRKEKRKMLSSRGVAWIEVDSSTEGLNCSFESRRKNTFGIVSSLPETAPRSSKTSVTEREKVQRKIGEQKKKKKKRCSLRGLLIRFNLKQLPKSECASIYASRRTHFQRKTKKRSRTLPFHRPSSSIGGSIYPLWILYVSSMQISLKTILGYTYADASD